MPSGEKSGLAPLLRLETVVQRQMVVRSALSSTLNPAWDKPGLAQLRLSSILFSHFLPNQLSVFAPVVEYST